MSDRLLGAFEGAAEKAFEREQPDVVCACGDQFEAKDLVSLRPGRRALSLKEWKTLTRLWWTLHCGPGHGPVQEKEPPMRTDLQQQLQIVVAQAYEDGSSRKAILDEVKHLLDDEDAARETSRAWVEVAPNLAFGNMSACSYDPEVQQAVVHACKDPCHRKAVAYAEKSLPTDHPDYLAAERGHHLYLNLIDPPIPLFKRESFLMFLAFVDKHIRERPVVIHCNHGESRAPSLALLYMAKRLGTLPASSYQLAAVAFRAIGFPYRPGEGIEKFLKDNWDAL